MNSREYASGKVTVIVAGEKSAVMTLLSAEFFRAISAFLKFIEAVRYSVPSGTSPVSANLLMRRVAADLFMEMISGGSELLASPFLSSSSRMDCGMAFSRIPSSVKRKIAVASPFLLMVISSELAVNA